MKQNKPKRNIDYTDKWEGYTDCGYNHSKYNLEENPTK